jgi:hypothetical protein
VNLVRRGEFRSEGLAKACVFLLGAPGVYLRQSSTGARLNGGKQGAGTIKFR